MNLSDTNRNLEICRDKLHARKGFRGKGKGWGKGNGATDLRRRTGETKAAEAALPLLLAF
jgi:hypothetical protein